MYIHVRHQQFHPAHLYIELMFDIPVVLKTVEKPRTINLMTFSKFIRDTKFLK